MKTTRLMWGAVAVTVLAMPAVAADTSRSQPTFRFGGAAALATPAGEFAEHVDVGGGLTGFALYGRPDGLFALRADAGWLLYGTETLRRPVRGTAGRVVEDVASTDNWIAHVTAGPQLMARSGRVRPYANAFGGLAYFATTSELLRPRLDRLVVTSPPGTPLIAARLDPFRTTTHFDDATATYGGGAGVLIALGSGGTALDLGVRYMANGRVRFLVEGDAVDGSLEARRARARLFEFRIGVTGLR
jgi:opacity protein-like surface antigen